MPQTSSRSSGPDPLVWISYLVLPPPLPWAQCQFSGGGVCRWITNCFSTANTICLHREVCLLPLPYLVRHQRRLSGLRLICSHPEVNPATACLSKTVPTFSPYHAHQAIQGKITNKLYHFINLDRHSSQDKARNLRYRHNAITALANTAAPLVEDTATLSPISLHGTDSLLPVPPMAPSS